MVKQLVRTTATALRLAPQVQVDLWDSESAMRDVTVGSASSGELSTDLLDSGTSSWQRLRCDLLPNWFEDWLLLEQENYRQNRLHALEQLSLTAQQRRQHGLALTAGLAAILAEPLRETAHRRVIEVHLAEGNSAEALRQYQMFRRLLADELGLPPSPALRRLIGPLLGRPVDQQQVEPEGLPRVAARSRSSHSLQAHASA